jgi:hypothetical protein
VVFAPWPRRIGVTALIVPTETYMLQNLKDFT